MPSVTCRRASVEIVPLVGHLRLGPHTPSPAVGRAASAGRPRRSPGPAGRSRMAAVQATLAALDLGELSSRPMRREVDRPAARHPAMPDARTRPRPQPADRGSHSATARNPWTIAGQQRLARAALGQRPRRERGRALGVTAELGQIDSDRARCRRGHSPAGWPPGPTVGSNGSPDPFAATRSAASISCSKSARWPLVPFSCRLRQQQPGTGPAPGRRAAPTASAGWSVLRHAGYRQRRSPARSAGRPRVISPAATACRIASSASPCP